MPLDSTQERISDLGQMVEILETIVPSMDVSPINVAVWGNFYDQLEATLCNNAENILEWLKELREYRRQT